MKHLHQHPTLDVSVDLRLTEQQMRALDALVGYGIKPFLAVFYQHMGKHYMEPHEKGLRSLFAVIQSELPPILKRADAARSAFVLDNPVIRSREQHEDLLNSVTEQTRQPALDALNKAYDAFQPGGPTNPQEAEACELLKTAIDKLTPRKEGASHADR